MQSFVPSIYDFTPLSTIMYVREDDPAALAAAAAKAANEKAVQDAVEAATKGLKAKNDELLGKIVKANETLKQFEGIDPVKVKEMLTRLDGDEDSKLISEGKTNVVIEKYTERMRAAHKEELEAERQKTVAEARRADTYKGAVLDNQIRAAANGLHKGAVEDALLHARQIFSLDPEGKAVKLNAEGRPELGKDGATPFSPFEWIEQQKELKPHWFPSSSSGGGSNGSSPAASGTGKTIKREDFNKLSPIEQAKTAQTTKIVD